MALSAGPLSTGSHCTRGRGPSDLPCTQIGTWALDKVGVWVPGDLGQGCRGTPDPRADQGDRAIPIISPQGWMGGTQDGGAKWRDVMKTSQMEARIWVGPESMEPLRDQGFLLGGLFIHRTFTISFSRAGTMASSPVSPKPGL